MSSRTAVGVLGATGTVGQQFVRLLANHPWFEATWLAGSERSSGRKYAEACNWKLSTPMPDAAAAQVVQEPVPGKGPKLVFSALDANVAGDIEKAFAAAGHLVVSNARNYRMDPLVPLLIPEINPDHLQLVPKQAEAYGWKGGIVTNSNCSTMFLAMALAPLRQFGLATCNVVTLQAVSGAGYPGVPSLDILGNIIPFIGGEEEKLEIEPQKILGSLAGTYVEPHPVVVSAHTTRVPVIDGHSEMISVGFEGTVAAADIRAAFEAFRGVPQELGLPSAPKQPLVYLEAENRPQPRLDVERDGGMAVFIGRLRPCPVLQHKFVALGHNTVRGAAGAALLNAELMQAQGLV
ncbi:aspartate-semialdehyde dehydrogenase [Luteitalea sp.]|jgi:aspartate-semialdehyde dehydrogenase|uniref:aspartate-semialdehyde dehydrogenase n=1 Tax=Luteitalea sp. TaxID=2004800 RepID=UPI0037C7B9B9